MTQKNANKIVLKTGKNVKESAIEFHHKTNYYQKENKILCAKQNSNLSNTIHKNYIGEIKRKSS